MKKPKFHIPKGMHDILPDEQSYYQKIYEVVAGAADFYGFGKIDTPMLEETKLFFQGIGPTTDIVKKEMYNLKTRGGDYLSLRPEGTAPIARAYIENGMSSLPQPVRLWYFGPFFRYENPQFNRYRQFWQFGFEVLGEGGSVVDAQIIQVLYNILKELKLKKMIVNINSIGCSQCRPYYKKLLTSYFRTRKTSVCADCRRRLQDNVLRILDCKEEKCQPLKQEAPQTLDHLCDECRAHFKEVLEFLDEIEIPYDLDPYLVRGLDYYTKTVFEIFSQTKSQDKSQTALGGGGRYDKLIKLMGGKDVPAGGGGVGVERVINLIKLQGIEIARNNKGRIFLAQLGNLAKRKSLRLLEDFRKAKIKVVELLGRDSLKVQLSRADYFGAEYTLIIGQKEALENSVIIRNMKTGRQETVRLDKVVEKVRKKLKKQI
jgi:histidyl-tRNA synthetase